MTSTRPVSSRPRTIKPNTPQRGGLVIPDAWLRGVLAGFESLLGPWLVVIVPAIAVYVATASAPELGTASWVEAVKVGTGMWLTAHGAHLETPEVTFTLIPLGVTMLAVWLTKSALTRARIETWVGVWFAGATYVAGVGVFAAVLGIPGAYRGVAGAAVIFLIASGWATRTHGPSTPHHLKSWPQQLLHRIEAQLNKWGNPATQVAEQARISVRAGWASAGRVLAGVLGLATIGVVAAVILGLPVIASVYERLELDVVSAVVLTLAQLAVVPTMVVWSAAYLAGPGFAMGVGSLYAPAEVISGPLPAIPILGALPDPDGVTLPIVGYVYLIVGIGAGWFAYRRVSRLSTGEPNLFTVLGAILVTVVVSGATIALGSLLASGGFGPQRFAEGVGPLTFEVTWALVWKVGAGMVAMVLVIHPATHRLVRTGWQKGKNLASRGEVS